MADTSIVASTSESDADLVVYEIGKPNWDPPWLPDLAQPGGIVALAEGQVIDVLLLGDGYRDRTELEAQLSSWITAFFQVSVYEAMRGAFRIRAVFRKSAQRVSSARDSYYHVPGGASGALSSSGSWWNGSSSDDVEFRSRLEQDMNLVGLNPARYPSSIDVGDETVIHNDLANMLSNCVVSMLARTASSMNASGFTRAVNLSGGRIVNIAFGANALHELGHAFAYLEDEYINGRGTVADRKNPVTPSLFTMSNLSFSARIDQVPWLHLSPWGRVARWAAGSEPSPVVGWAWRGGEHDLSVWHSEYNCLMNGSHDNYRFTSVASADPTANADGSYTDENGANLRASTRYCLWCQEIVVARILEKTGQLVRPGDPADINEAGRAYHERWESTWRERYWQFFGGDSQIADREALYADASQFPALQQAGLVLWQSDLYKVFAAAPSSAGQAGTDDDDLELLMANA
jgi:hypothetical protein